MIFLRVFQLALFFGAFVWFQFYPCLTVGAFMAFTAVMYLSACLDYQTESLR